MEEKMNDTAQDGSLMYTSKMTSQGSVSNSNVGAGYRHKEHTLSKHKYVQRSAGTGVDLQLNTKKEFDEEREKRIQLYAERWENGCECLSGKPMQGGSWEEWYQWRLRYDLKTKKDQKFLSEGK